MNLHSISPRHNRIWLLISLLGLVLIIASISSGVKLTGFSMTDEAGAISRIELPHFKAGTEPGVYKFQGEIELDWLAPRTYELAPDDKLISLALNGQNINLSKPATERMTETDRTVTLKLDQFLKVGKNSLEINAQNFDDETVIHLKPSPWDARNICQWLGWLTVACLIVVTLAKRWGLKAVEATLYLFIALGSLVRAWYVFTYNPVHHIYSDPERHWNHGVDILGRGLMSLTDPIGYQVYLAVLGKLTLQLPMLVAYFTIILSLLTPWVWYRFLRELQSSKAWALMGWALLSLLPSWITIYGYFMQETLFLPLLGGALWATWRCRRKGDSVSFNIMVILWIAASLTRGIAIPMAAVACIWLWLAQRSKLEKSIYSSLILLAILGPLTYRSYQTVNHFAPHGMGHVAAIYAQSGKKQIEVNVEHAGQWWFASPSMSAKPFAPISEWTTRREGEISVYVDLQKGMEGWRAAMAGVEMSWTKYAWVTKENLVFLFFANSWPDTRSERLVDQLSSAMRWIWAPLFGLAFLALARNFKHHRSQLLLPAIVVAWFVVQGMIPISVNEGRYRKPLEGLIIAQIILWASSRRAKEQQRSERGAVRG